MLPLSFENWLALIGVYVTLVTGGWYVFNWLSKKFKEIFDKIDNVKETVLTKLDYHERHDDKRFSEVNNNIWELRLRQVVVENRGQVFDQEDRSSEAKRRPSQTGGSLS